MRGRTRSRPTTWTASSERSRPERTSSGCCDAEPQIHGRFCSIYPFSIFGHGWEDATPEAWPHKGDTVVGHDVWIGYGSTILPGVTIGHGAVVAACSVVTKDVEPYAIVGGNPARVIRHRFEPEVIEELLELAWWDWPIERITEKAGAIVRGEMGELRE